MGLTDNPAVDLAPVDLSPDATPPELLEQRGFMVTSIDKLYNWARTGSMWPMTFGLACCAIEMMATGASRYDIDRFGAGAFRATPRQADLMIVAGTVTYKMGSRVRRLYNMMPDPKFVIAMGACTVSGGPYIKHGYHVLKGVDRIVPVDVYVPGCPPRPEALLEALRDLRKSIADADGVPPYVVFHDATLLEMIEQRPTSLGEMLEVSGIGQAKLQKYGQPFLDVLTEFAPGAAS